MYTDEAKLRQLLTILVDNAIKYTDPGGSIRVSNSNGGSTVTLCIANSHDGVEAEELPKFFERFYQGDVSHHATGAGLGLAIAKEVAQTTGIGLGVESRNDEMLFTLEVKTTAR